MITHLSHYANWRAVTSWIRKRKNTNTHAHIWPHKYVCVSALFTFRYPSVHVQSKKNLHNVCDLFLFMSIYIHNMMYNSWSQRQFITWNKKLYIYIWYKETVLMNAVHRDKQFFLSDNNNKGIEKASLSMIEIMQDLHNIYILFWCCSYSFSWSTHESMCVTIQ
jgi:hypothetical protein